MIKKFYLFENTLYSSLKSVASEEDELKKLIGFDPKKYDLTILSKDSFQLSFKENFLTDFLEIEDGMLRLFLSITSNYSDYELYTDESEIDFISNYLTDENLHKLNILLDFLDIKEEQNLYYICKVLGRDFIDMSDTIYELSSAREEAVVHDAREVFKKLPFDISSAYSGGWDIDITFEIEKIGEYIEKNNLKDINTISDFLKNVDFSDFSYDVENFYESSYEIDFSEMNKEFEKEINSVLDKIGIDADNYYKKSKDDSQLNLFDDEEYSKTISKNYKFDRFLSNLDLKNFYEVENLGGKLLAWFKSYEFQKNYMKSRDLKKYNKLKDYKIIHPDIEKEYDYLDSANKYNL